MDFINSGLRLAALLLVAAIQMGCEHPQETDASSGGEGVPAKRPEPAGISAAALEGKSADEVRATLGAPSGEMKSSRGMAWNYPGWYIEFSKDGVVTKVESLKTASSPAQPAVAANVKAVMVHAQGGKQVDIKTLMPPGKITIVDFYADWCGPCRAISPKLEKLAKEDPDVVLRKVDIVKWGTPITRQYSIDSVPNIRVYDRSRNPVGAPTHSLKALLSSVAKAKKK